ncbi:MAG: two-component system response regulator [Candidatus Limnocylindria bacterium]
MTTSMRVIEHSERQDASLQARGPVLFVVDDDAATLELMCEIAEDAGWAAFGFTRLAEVSRALDERRPTVLILDDDLPDGRGGDLARAMREDPRMRDVTLLVCTAAHPMRQAEIGAWAPVVSKPFDLGEIEGFLAAAGSTSGRGSGRSDEFERAG